MHMDAQQKRKLRRLLFIAMLGMIGVAIVLAMNRRGEWIIPEGANQRQNPLSASPRVLDSARVLYKEKCVQCHGETGKGDGPDAGKHNVAPSDLTNSSRISALSDGALFYEITEGRRPMPSFKSRLTEEQRWQLVLLIKSLASSPATANPK
jgi:mono/diheme cytochrome c family protein